MKRVAPSSLFSQILIDTPCRESWDAMTGDEGTRYCSRCNKNVHNLKDMTESEVFRLLNKSDPVCIRLFRRPDGTILTKECGVGFRRRWSTRAVLAGALFAVVGPFGLKRTVAEEPERKEDISNYQMEMGGVPQYNEKVDLKTTQTPTPIATPTDADKSKS